MPYLDVTHYRYNLPKPKRQLHLLFWQLHPINKAGSLHLELVGQRWIRGRIFAGEFFVFLRDQESARKLRKGYKPEVSVRQATVEVQKNWVALRCSRHRLRSVEKSIKSKLTLDSRKSIILSANVESVDRNIVLNRPTDRLNKSRDAVHFIFTFQIRVEIWKIRMFPIFVWRFQTEH